MDTRVCDRCGVAKPLTSFGKVSNRKPQYRRKTCGTCRSRHDYARSKARHSRYRRAVRRRDVAGAIYSDSRRSDKRFGRENTLTRRFIAVWLRHGCFYCGERYLRMTLDRIDNDRGHTPDNVLPACIRCNYARKDMPFAAWLIVADGMRAARMAGAFGEWTGRVK